MEVILQELGLGTLIDRFSEERVDPDVLVSLNDNELVRLGVNTIGERVRLRELCRKKLADSQPGTQSRSSVLAQERSLLFAPSTSTSRRTTSTERKKKNTKKRPWTVQFMCLADRYSSKVPTSSQKQILYKAGLGIKKIKLDLDDDEQTVKDKITSDVEEDEVQTVVGFPQLRSCGGFEMVSGRFVPQPFRPQPFRPQPFRPQPFRPQAQPFRPPSAKGCSDCQVYTCSFFSGLKLAMRITDNSLCESLKNRPKKSSEPIFKTRSKPHATCARLQFEKQKIFQ